MAENKNRLTARERIVSDKIESARDQTISNQLNLEFLKGFKAKSDAKKVELNGTCFGEGQLDKMINSLEDMCVFSLEELNFYKNTRANMDSKKIDKAARKASVDLEKFPETINMDSLKEIKKQPN